MEKALNHYPQIALDGEPPFFLMDEYLPMPAKDFMQRYIANLKKAIQEKKIELDGLFK